MKGLVLTIISLVIAGCTKQLEDPRKALAPGVISTEAHEYFPTFTPDGKTLYFSRADGKWGDEQTRTYLYIFKTELQGDSWSPPEVASFSGKYDDSDPFISPDGSQLYFTSNRPVSGETKSDADIWMINLQSGSEPQHLGFTVNSPEEEYSPVVTNSGRLYFASRRQGGKGQGDFYYSDLIDSVYSEPTDIYKINRKTGEWNLYVDPEETFIIFEASGRIPRRYYGDLFITFMGRYGWQEPIALDLINTPGSDIGVRFSPDGRKVYYASQEDLHGQISKIHLDNKTAYHTKPTDNHVNIYVIEADSLMASIQRLN